MTFQVCVSRSISLLSGVGGKEDEDSVKDILIQRFSDLLACVRLGVVEGGGGGKTIIKNTKK